MSFKNISYLLVHGPLTVPKWTKMNVPSCKIVPIFNKACVRLSCQLQSAPNWTLHRTGMQPNCYWYRWYHVRQHSFSSLHFRYSMHRIFPTSASRMLCAFNSSLLNNLKSSCVRIPVENVLRILPARNRFEITVFRLMRVNKRERHASWKVSWYKLNLFPLSARIDWTKNTAPLHHYSVLVYLVLVFRVAALLAQPPGTSWLQLPSFPLFTRTHVRYARYRIRWKP